MTDTEWKETHRNVIGVDAWNGRGDVPGWCVVYEVTRTNEKTHEQRVAVERGPSVYVEALEQDAAIPYSALLSMYVTTQKALRSYAEAAARSKG